LFIDRRLNAALFNVERLTVVSRGMTRNRW